MEGDGLFYILLKQLKIYNILQVCVGACVCVFCKDSSVIIPEKFTFPSWPGGNLKPPLDLRVAWSRPILSAQSCTTYTSWRASPRHVTCLLISYPPSSFAVLIFVLLQSPALVKICVSFAQSWRRGCIEIINLNIHYAVRFDPRLFLLIRAAAWSSSCASSLFRCPFASEEELILALHILNSQQTNGLEMYQT